MFAAPKYTIKVGTVVSETHPDYITLRNVFKKKIEEQSKGAIKVELYANAQLGGDREMIESLQLGTLTMALPASAALSGFEKNSRFWIFPICLRARRLPSRRWTESWVKPWMRCCRNTGSLTFAILRTDPAM